MEKSCKKCAHLASDDDAQFMTGDCVGCVDHSKFRLNLFAIDDDPTKTNTQRMVEFYAENLDLKSMFPQLKTSETDDDPTPDYYNYRYKGMKIDPYRGGDIFGITCPALFHAWKKIIRAGKDAKSYKEDIKEARNSLNRKLEMLEEDENDNIDR